MCKMCTGIQNAMPSDDDDIVGEAARCDTHPGDRHGKTFGKKALVTCGSSD